MSVVKINLSNYQGQGSKPDWVGGVADFPHFCFLNSAFKHKNNNPLQTTLFTAAMTQQLCSAVWVTSGRGFTENDPSSDYWVRIQLRATETMSLRWDDSVVMCCPCGFFHKYCSHNRKCVGKTTKCNCVYWYGHLQELSSNTAEVKED